MQIVINTSSMIPIYEQIMESIKKMIISGELRNGDPLPSIRALSADLKISSLTVKKAYDELEAEGYTATVHGKGSYVTGANRELIIERQKQDIEQDLSQIIRKGRVYGISDDELRQLLELLLGE